MARAGRYGVGSPHAVFDEQKFRQQVDKALQTVRMVLESTRSPSYAADSDHSFEDKYALSEFLANSAIAAQVNVLERMGVDAAKLARLKEMSEIRSVTIRFACEETCTLAKEVEVEQGSSTQSVTEMEKGGHKEITTRKVITNITEYHWSCGLEYELYAFSGNEPGDRVDLQSRSCSCEIVTTGKIAPRPRSVKPTPIDVPITWLMQNISAQSVCSFTIDRSANSCRTPRRNDEVDAGLQFFGTFGDWATRLHKYFARELAGGVQRRDGIFPPAFFDIASIDTHELFVPVLPLFDGTEGAPRAEATTGSSMVTMPGATTDAVAISPSPLLSVGDINRFLNEQCNSLAAKHGILTQTFPVPEGDQLISVSEAWLSLLALHAVQIGEHFGNGVGYIESMLHSQLVAAIGKEIQPKDFAEFVRFHERKLFKPAFAPEPFCYAIRRPDHYPDGVLSIEAAGDNEPIMTITRKLEAPCTEDGCTTHAMHFPINAATHVELQGERYLHAWVPHEFAGQGGTEGVSLIARARQFSSFLLMVGNIAGPSSFTPEHAIILQNKDELLLPLLLEQLPTPQEFKDAIESLSPEQKRFATAFRAMQLESSVFGVCVVQLKPQLEALLGLDDDSLTKEIQLTQDLLSLFIEYQIPSDLLAFEVRDAREEATAAEKIDAVKGHVKAVQDMLQAARAAEIAEEEEKARLEKEKARLEKEKEERAKAERTSREPVDDTSFYYKELSVEKSATDAEIKRAYRKLAVRHHPDRGGDPEKFKNITEAYECLSDPSKRELYDQSGAAGVEAGGHGIFSRGGDAIFSQMFGGRKDAFSDFFSGAADDFGGGFAFGGGGPSAPTGPPRTAFDHGAGAVPAPAQQQHQQQHQHQHQHQQHQHQHQHQQHQHQHQHQHQRPKISPSEAGPGGEIGAEAIDLTQIPKRLDAQFEALDEGAALRPTIIKTGTRWTKRFQESILGKLVELEMGSDAQKIEKNAAFDLLDALSRSGALPITCAELHVVVASTHCFDKSLTDTVVCDNVNPIEKLERSTLIVASTIHDVATATLLKGDDQAARVLEHSPSLFLRASGECH